MKKLFVVLFVMSASLSAFSQGGDLENQFYFRFGLSKPTKSYLGVDNDASWDDVKRTGGVFEIGSIFMLNSLPFPDGLRLGINADYAEFTYQQLKIDNDVTGTFSIASKVGPSLSYSPVSDLVFDVYIKGKLNWLTVMANVYDDPNSVNDAYAGVMNLGYATGLNVRYKFLMLAFEFNNTKSKLVWSEDSNVYFGDVGTNSDKTPLPYWNIMFGFSF